MGLEPGGAVCAVRSASIFFSHWLTLPDVLVSMTYGGRAEAFDEARRAPGR